MTPQYQVQIRFVSMSERRREDWEKHLLAMAEEGNAHLARQQKNANQRARRRSLKATP